MLMVDDPLLTQVYAFTKGLYELDKNSSMSGKRFEEDDIDVNREVTIFTIYIPMSSDTTNKKIKLTAIFLHTRTKGINVKRTVQCLKSVQNHITTMYYKVIGGISECYIAFQYNYPRLPLEFPGEFSEASPDDIAKFDEIFREATIDTIKELNSEQK